MEKKKWHAGEQKRQSLKRVKIEEKLLSSHGHWTSYRLETHQRSFERYHPRPLGPPLSQNLGFVTPTQNCNLKFWATAEC